MASKSNQPAGNWEQRTRQPDGSSAAAGRGDEGVLSEMATAVKDRAQGMASAVASTAEDAWDGTRHGVQRAASAVADTAGDAWGDLTGLMRRYPFGTLFVGMGVGFLLSRLLEERRTHELRHLGAELYDRVRDYASDVTSKLRS